MKCLYCNSTNSKVTDSRFIEEDNTIRRRRECLNCGKRFTTYERVETSPVLVIKKDGTRQAFNIEKLKDSIVKACDKRQVSFEQIEKIVNKIEKEIMNSNGHEILSKKIGEMVMKELRNIDEVAYIRFASVYRRFTDVTNFIDLIDKLN